MTHVKYKVYNEENVVLDKNAACFATFFNKFREKGFIWTCAKVHIYSHDKVDKKLKYFWLELMKEIEPSMEIEEDKTEGTWIKFPNLPKGKTKVFLTVLRYIWEDSFVKIPEITKEVLRIYKRMDKLKAIYLAHIKSGAVRNGHALFVGCVPKLPLIKDYKEFNGKGVFEFSGCDILGSYEGDKTFNELSQKTIKEIRQYFIDKKKEEKKEEKTKTSKKKSLSL